MQVTILGGGAIGCALAAQLGAAGRPARVVRTSPATQAGPAERRVELRGPQGDLTSALSLGYLDAEGPLPGALVVTAKAFANERIAAALHRRGALGPIVLLQNGIGVEAPFAQLPNPLYRCVLYTTSQWEGAAELRFRSVRPSPIGALQGTLDELEALVAALDTPAFRFEREDQIATQVWSKGIANSVFNTICPLLEVDNGIFSRSEQAAALAREVIAECVPVAAALGVQLDPAALLAKTLEISAGTSGQRISTLEDLRRGRPTEIAYLNLAIAEIADEHGLTARLTRSLGELIALRESLSQG